MNKQIALSIDEMKHLEELGLDISDASMCYIVNNHINPPSEGLMLYNKDFAYQIEGHDIIPAYTLQDILKKLPKEFDVEDSHYHSLSLKQLSNGDWMCEYIRNCDVYIHIVDELRYTDNTPLNASYGMLEFLIENNYIKNN